MDANAAASFVGMIATAQVGVTNETIMLHVHALFASISMQNEWLAKIADSMAALEYRVQRIEGVREGRHKVAELFQRLENLEARVAVAAPQTL